MTYKNNIVIIYLWKRFHNFKYGKILAGYPAVCALRKQRETVCKFIKGNIKVANLSLRHVCKIYPARHKTKSKKGDTTTRVTNDFVAVKDFNMEIDDGDFIVFVGPSGCGKSTTLRMIAGLEDITSGELYIDGQLVNSVEPKDRDIAMVFQSYALYPHMTSYDNIAFGLRMRKILSPVMLPDEEKVAEISAQITEVKARISSLRANKADEEEIEEAQKRLAELKSQAEEYKHCKPMIAIDEKKIKELEKKIKAAEGDRRRLANAHEKKILRFALDRRKCEQRAEKLKDTENAEEKIAEIQAEIDRIILDADYENRATELTDNEVRKRIEAYNKDLEYYRSTPVQIYRPRNYTKAEIDEKVQWAAEILGIKELLPSKPAEMSGGQRQRIALGRAMVRGPKVFLLDEPLSNLDAKLRTAMRSEIVKLHKQLKTTFIYVTHDQVEAMTMGTRIVVMKDGVVQQIDTPTNLFDYPKNRFVAGFIGTPQMNFFDVTIQKKGTKLKVVFENGENMSFVLSELRKIREDILDGQEHSVVLGVRGESIRMASEGLSAMISIKEVLGNDTHLFVKIGSGEYIICNNRRVNCEPGDPVKITFDGKDIHLFDSVTEETLFGD